MTTDSILPGNLSDLERGIDTALSRIAEIDIPISTLWDPWNCPVDALPYLAWALSVDVWDDDWPENIKRGVVANSISVHEIKGTRQALNSAMSDIDLTIKIREWFETDPPGSRGTFRIDVYSERQPITQELADFVGRTIEGVKRKSAHYDGISLNIKSQSKVVLSGLALTSETVKMYPRQLKNLGSTCSLKVASGARLQEKVVLKPRGGYGI